MRPERMVCMMTFLTLMFTSLLVFPSHSDAEEVSNTIYVGPHGNHTTIQAAVDAASNGDTIIVDDGIYHENLSIKKDLAIESLNGSAYTTIKGTGSVAVEVITDYFRIKGFNITGGASEFPSPVISTGIDFTSTDNRLGVVIENCDINDFGRHAIEIHMGKNVKISNSTIRSVRDGISIDICTDTLVRNCSITAERTGVKLGGGSKNIIEGCTITGSEENLEIFNTKNNTVAYNNISGGSRYGLMMYFYADGNTIVGNDFFDNEEWAINMDFSSGNWVYHNNFYNNNEGNVQARGVTDSRWDDGSLGNYWSDYGNRYPGAIELPDGTYNATYEVLNAIGDEHPLVEPFERSDRPMIIMEEDWASKDFYETRAFSLQLKAIDLDTPLESLSWSMKTNASFLNFKVGNIIHGIPKSQHIGRYWVNISVSDGKFSDWMNFTIVIKEWHNHSLPHITTQPVTLCNEDSLYSVKYEADTNFTLQWIVKTNASFLSMGQATGYLNGTPTNNDVGTYWVNVSVSDTTGHEYQNFTLEVLNTNDPPVITSSNIESWNTNKSYSNDYNATDIDPTGDVIYWSLTTNCSFLSIDTNTGVLSGNSTNSYSGIFWVNVTATDNNGGWSFTMFTLTVIDEDNNNEAPELNVILPDDIDGTDDVFTLDTTDLDADNLTIVWYLEGIGEVGRGETFTLNIDDGTYDLTVNITDAKGNSFEKTYVITVSSNNGGQGVLEEYGLLIVSCAIIALILILIGVLLIYRRKRHTEIHEDGPPIIDDIPSSGRKGLQSKGLDFEPELRSGTLMGSRRSMPIDHDVDESAEGVGIQDIPMDELEMEDYFHSLQKEIINGDDNRRTGRMKLKRSLKEMRRKEEISPAVFDLAMGIVEE